MIYTKPSQYEQHLNNKHHALIIMQVFISVLFISRYRTTFKQQASCLAYNLSIHICSVHFKTPHIQCSGEPMHTWHVPSSLLEQTPKSFMRVQQLSTVCYCWTPNAPVPWLLMKWHCKLVYGWMVYTELALRQQQFHVAPAMHAATKERYRYTISVDIKTTRYKKNKVTHSESRATCAQRVCLSAENSAI